MKQKKHTVIAGAGSIGCFTGGLLLHASQNVSFLGRDRTKQELLENDLKLTDYTGTEISISPDALKISTTPDVLELADIILVTVKSGSTNEIAQQIKANAPSHAIIVSLQNGIGNTDILRKILPDFDVRAGMVPFNVVQKGNGWFHRGTSGNIVIERGSNRIPEFNASEHLTVKTSANIENIQWGKLLINLNNALNALSGLTLLDQLSNRSWRIKMADQVQEALAVLKAAGIQPDPPAPVSAWVIPHILRLPTPVFRLIAKQMISIDPEARSSMWEDIQRGRKTEIDELQGEIIRLGEKHGTETPINLKVRDQILELESSSD